MNNDFLNALTQSTRQAPPAARQQRARSVRWIFGLAVCAAFNGAALAQNTPVGLWKSIDDDTHVEKSLVRIVDQGGSLDGTIEKLLDPAAPPNPVCDKCSDERKGRPLVGLVIIRNARADPADAASWTGGEILDPSNGTTYRLRLKPVAGGKQLEVRGYIGTPMLGRTQTWVRVDDQGGGRGTP
jgi:uncharacterized protein (DUF2147 family)